MSSRVVIDASIAVKWVLDVPDSSKAKALLADWLKLETMILAPALIAYEASNALYKYVSVGQLPLEDGELGLKNIILPVLKIDFSNDMALSAQALRFASQFKLPATYDAYYLALAKYNKCELWTSDIKMWRKVGSELDWVHTLNEYPMS